MTSEQTPTHAGERALPAPLVRVELPLVTVVEANAARKSTTRERIRRSRDQRAWSRMICRSRSAPPPLPLLVVLTRSSAGTPDDDGLVSALKFIRDGVSDWLQRNDRSDDHVPGLRFLYRATRGRTGVTVEVYPLRPEGATETDPDVLAAAWSLRLLLDARGRSVDGVAVIVGRGQSVA